MKSLIISSRSNNLISLLWLPIILSLSHFILTPFYKSLVTEVMMWSILALGFNMLYRYTGMMSLGHSLFFGIGMYSTALTILRLGYGPFASMLLGIFASLVVSSLLALLLVKPRGVYFMLTTLVISMAAYLAALHWKEITGGQDGLVVIIPIEDMLTIKFSLYDPTTKYYLTLLALSCSYIVFCLIYRMPLGKVLLAIKDNEEKVRFLGYDVSKYIMVAISISGTISGLAGSLYVLTKGYAGAALLNISTSINPILWTLVGGKNSAWGPLLGTFIMVPATRILSSFTEAYLLIVGVMLAIIVLKAPDGIAGVIEKIRGKR